MRSNGLVKGHKMNIYKMTATSDTTVVEVTVKAEDALDAFSKVVQITNLDTTYEVVTELLWGAKV
tara:strand:+ start:2032 stop:2226 length:195 start_codon:yes stop_codon:yes gene_type:complete